MVCKPAVECTGYHFVGIAVAVAGIVGIAAAAVDAAAAAVVVVAVAGLPVLTLVS